MTKIISFAVTLVACSVYYIIRIVGNIQMVRKCVYAPNCIFDYDLCTVRNCVAHSCTLLKLLAHFIVFQASADNAGTNTSKEAPSINRV